MKKFLLVFLIVLIFVASNLFADDLEETLQELSEDAAKSYVNPVVSAFGSNLNGGWYHKAPKSKIFGIDIEIGVVFMGTLFDADNKTFSTEGSFRFNRNQAEELTVDLPSAIQDSVINAIITQDFDVGIYGPTIVGDKKDSVKIEFYSEDVTYNSPSGDTATVNVPGKVIPLPVKGLLGEVPALPLFAPQLSVGTVFGTQAVLRYVPAIEIENLGEFNYFGFGIQHNPKVWLPISIPVDISASFFTQSMEIGDVASANATAFGLNVSKTFGVKMLNLTPYGGYMYENSSMEFNYDYAIDTPAGPSTQEISFKLDGENESRITVGLSLRLGVLNLNVDYNMAKYNSVTAGVGFGLTF
ncbi:MAG: DUF6588 family protein [Candidatus Cloacimonadota bacterium]|nr:DUF6588 family protein [Candidatus Cloacimonadota bacterium]